MEVSIVYYFILCICINLWKTPSFSYSVLPHPRRTFATANTTSPSLLGTSHSWSFIQVLKPTLPAAAVAAKYIFHFSGEVMLMRIYFPSLAFYIA